VNSSGSEESLNGYNSGAGGGDVTRDDEETDQWAQRKKRGSSKRSISRLLSLTKARINGSHDASCRSQQQQQQQQGHRRIGVGAGLVNGRQMIDSSWLLLQLFHCRQHCAVHRCVGIGQASFVHQSSVTGQGQGQPPDAV
jgi:hypothetical protein